jgi:hypothetical protein
MNRENVYVALYTIGVSGASLAITFLPIFTMGIV